MDESGRIGGGGGGGQRERCLRVTRGEGDMHGRALLSWLAGACASSHPQHMRMNAVQLKKEAFGGAFAEVVLTPCVGCRSKSRRRRRAGGRWGAAGREGAGGGRRQGGHSSTNPDCRSRRWFLLRALRVASRHEAGLRRLRPRPSALAHREAWTCLSQQKCAVGIPIRSHGPLQRVEWADIPPTPCGPLACRRRRSAVLGAGGWSAPRPCGAPPRTGAAAALRGQPKCPRS